MKHFPQCVPFIQSWLIASDILPQFALKTLTAIRFVRSVTTILYSVTYKQRINVLKVITSEYDVTSRRCHGWSIVPPVDSVYVLLLNVIIKLLTIITFKKDYFSDNMVLIIDRSFVNDQDVWIIKSYTIPNLTALYTW